MKMVHDDRKPARPHSEEGHNEFILKINTEEYCKPSLEGLNPSRKGTK